MEVKIMSYEDWVYKYKPIRNPFNEKQTGEDEDFQIGWSTLEENDLLNDNKGENRIWTMIEGERDSIWLKSGYHRVDRLHHFITEIPYEKEFQIEYLEGYPKINNDDLTVLESIKTYMKSRDEPKYINTLDKVIEYVKRTI